ncbi:MAG: hypothetical protein AAFR47_05185 [Pseudomonadota bacterium]
MNADQMINRLIRMFTRRAVNKGMRAGIDHVARGGQDPADMTPEERKRARAMRKQAQGARRAARMAKRMGRF